LKRNKLKDVKGAEIILKDVIEDRNHMESDGANIHQITKNKLFE
jgi:hypothetical protein